MDLPLLSPWEALLVALAGVTVTILVLAVGRSLFRSWRHHTRGAVVPDLTSPEIPKPPAPPRPLDRRKAPRRRRREPVLVHISDPEFQAPPLDGWVLDSSIDGLQLSVRDQIAEGTFLGLRLPTISGAQPAIVEVRHCRPDQDRWLLGCQFQTTPSWEVLRALGIIG